MTARPSDPLDAEIAAALEGVDLQAMPATTEEASRQRSRDDKLRRGTVVGITGKDVFVELGPRVQGVCDLGEFESPPRVGESFDFSVAGREDDLWLLSRREAVALATWEELEKGSLVEGRVTGQNTGGLELRVGQIAAFLPASQSGLGSSEQLATLIGQKLVCEVLEVDRVKKRIVLSRRAVLDRERDAARSQAVESLAPGDRVRGKVRRVEAYGAFVEISPGVEGLVHVSNLSRKRVEDPNDLIHVGDTVDALVLEVKEGGRRIGLSMKALEPDPWEGLEQRLSEGSIVNGKVVKFIEHGAFVEIEPGVEGLLHVSQLKSGERVRRAQDLLRVGEELSLRVVSVDPFRRRISLSRLDPEGAVIGSEDATDASAVREVLSQPPGRLGTNLGDLFRKAGRDPGGARRP
jgi:small subunit ribosomal protein S1